MRSSRVTEAFVPKYDYRCTDCESVFEVTQGFDSEPRADCPRCGGVSRRLISRVAIHFKGSGWYSTDNRSPGATNGVTDSSDSGGGKEKKKKDGSAKAETKNPASDAKPSSSSESASKST